MVEAVAAELVVALELHPGSRVGPHTTTSARRQDSCGSIVVVVDSHIQGIVLASEETTVT